MRDYHGREITVEEGPDDTITVWTIEPAIGTDYEYTVVRCYQDAVEYAKRVVESLMDDPGVELPIKVIISQYKMPLYAYEEICGGGA